MTTQTTTAEAAASPSAGEHEALPPARRPAGTAAATWTGQLLALLVIVLGVGALQDAASRADLISQQSWIDAVVGYADGTSSDSATVLLIGVAAVLVGLVLLVLGLRRRPRRSVELRAATGVRLKSRDLARLVRERAETADGVTRVRVGASRRSVRVVADSVTGADRRDEVAADVRARAESVLEALERAPRLSVKVAGGEG